jgi:transcriptional regulator with XRE-family HTH domain
MYSNRLKEFRKEAGLSQSELGRRAGIAESNYSKIENGIVPAWPKAKRRLARVLKVRIAELFPEG